MKRRLKINLCSWQLLEWVDTVVQFFYFFFFPIPGMLCSSGVTRHQGSRVVSWPVQLKARHDLCGVKRTFFALTCLILVIWRCRYPDSSPWQSPSSSSQPCVPSCTCRISWCDGDLSFKFARVGLLTAGCLSHLEYYGIWYIWYITPLMSGS